VVVIGLPNDAISGRWGKPAELKIIQAKRCERKKEAVILGARPLTKRGKMKKLSVEFVLLVVCLLVCGGCADDFPFDDYQSMRARMGELVQQDSLREAAELLELALPGFPDHIEANAFNLAYLYGRLGETSRGVTALNYAFDHGVWFNIYGFQAPYYDPYRELDEFQTIVARNDSLRAIAQESASPDMKVVLPEGYTAEREYPLFIALHGGSGNMDEFSEVWKSERLTSDFIVVYVQSSLVVSMTGFSWTQDLEVSMREVTEAYERVMGDYRIDTSEVLVGGFSAGGIASLEVVLGDDLPISGFVVLCPARPENFTQDVLREVRARGVRGSILTTEMDPNVGAQREMAQLLKEIDFPHQFVVTPDVGHWIPDNLGELVDSAIEHIVGG
jgi:predicted esterase